MLPTGSPGLLLNEVPEVLFLCVQNAGRSQMAAALLNHASNGEVIARSAGSDPSDAIHDNVREALAEVGIEIEDAPRRFTDKDIESADIIVTMGCGDSCPVLPGKKYLDWEEADPAGQSIETVKNIRDSIDDRVRDLLAHMRKGALSG